MTITIDDIELQLAQTQCTECGFAGCRPYAEALVRGNAEINLCRPGGARVIENLAKLLDREVIAPAQAVERPQIAMIDESHCIGCTICIQACPTDAFIGAPKMVHELIVEDCTGCKLCVPVCPTHCISMGVGGVENTAERATQVRALVQAKEARKRAKKAEKLAAAKSGKKAAKKGISAAQWGKINLARAATRKKLAEKQAK